MIEEYEDMPLNWIEAWQNNGYNIYGIVCFPYTDKLDKSLDKYSSDSGL